MKKFAISLFFILFSISAAFAQKTDKPIVAKPDARTTKPIIVRPDPKKDVETAFNRLVEGIKQVDVNKVMSAYDNTDRILFFNNNGSVTIGWENMRKNRETSYANIKNVSLDITGLRIEMLGADAAYLTCKWKQQQEYNGKLESSSGRMTLVYRLIGKDWKIVHIHTSPDNPDATRPVFPSERQPNQ